MTGKDFQVAFSCEDSLSNLRILWGEKRCLSSKSIGLLKRGELEGKIQFQKFQEKVPEQFLTAQIQENINLCAAIIHV